MTSLLLITVPPFALLVWRQDVPSAMALLGAMALCAFLDWRAHKTDWNGSVSVDIDHINHALKVLQSDVTALTAKVETVDGRTLPLAAHMKELRESVERHATQLATHGQRKPVL